MNNQLSKNIIATITYFDVSDYPLTAFEIWKHLIKANPTLESKTIQQKWSLTEVLQALENEKIQEYISQKNGFYFLYGREKIVAIRSRREILNIYKIRKLRRRISLLRCIPFVRMICLTGRLSQKNGTEESDLDVFIVLKNEHIWTGRFLMTAVTHIFGWRRYGKKEKDRICLNYYVTDKSLKVPTQDLFAAHEYSFILPLFDSGKVFNKFQQVNCLWMQAHKPNYNFLDFKSELTIFDSKFSFWTRVIFEKIFNFKYIENKMRKLQQQKILNNPKSKFNGALIIANDKHLVFLPKPHGPKIFTEYKRRFEALEIM